MRTASFFSIAAATCVFMPAALSGGCNEKSPTPVTYFQSSVAPIFSTSCTRGPTGAGCHVADEKGYSLGNLDLSSFDGLNHRRDLLLNYGPYGQPALLLKNVPNSQVAIQTFDGQKLTVTTDIRHVGGPILDPTASAYQTLRRYLQDGATQNNSGAPPPTLARLPCSTTVPGAPGFDGTKDPGTADYATFTGQVNSTIGSTCAAANCHGTPSNDLNLTCGTTDEQKRWNYFAATQYLAQTPEQSEFIRRPLAPEQGGSFHEGGVIFPTTQDSSYQAFLEWAKQHGPPNYGTLDPNFLFFAHRVQPMLVKKGCMQMQCHSAALFHDYRLRGGSAGSFSLSASQRNYDLSVLQMSFESDDVNASRLVRKNLFRPDQFPGSPGITHRGGPLLEGSTDFGQDKLASGAFCDMQSFDYDGAALDTVPAYCMIREWHKRERTARTLAPLSAIVYVKRPIASSTGAPQEFETFAGGAELHIVQATVGATGNVTAGADAAVDLTTCGLPAQADVRRPAVSWDGTTIAFAARGTASDPLQVYTVNANGTGCARHAGINDQPAMIGGVLAHNFDPAWSPPDASGVVRLVFASTRGYSADANTLDYSGPQRTPADPSKLNANLYVFEPTPGGAPGMVRNRQLTYQLNMERYPSFMSDGRVIFTTEKRAPGFYQLALRRQNLDGGDYHPLFAQRSSIGYHQATYVVELADKNFAAIFSDKGAKFGGGTLGVFNRSLGIDFTSTDTADKKDYILDPTVAIPGSPTSVEPNFFLHSLKFPDPAASGHVGATTDGVYTSPGALPNDKMLVSFGAAGQADTFGGDYDLYVLDPTDGTKTKLLGDPAFAEIEAVGIYARAPKGVFVSSLNEPNGHTHIDTTEQQKFADVTVLDFPMIASILFQNTPTGRVIEDVSSVDVYEELPPPLSMTAFTSDPFVAADDGYGQLYVKRRKMGTVPLASDGSAHFTIPGGLPMVLKLPDSPQSMAAGGLPRWQREEMTFMPGETVNQSFRRDFFNGFCGQCHGSISGKPVDIALQPDILTQASSIIARGSTPTPLNIPPAERGTPVQPLPTP